MTFNKSGSKYLRPVVGGIDDKVDVYAVLATFNVTCPARQHAIKKLLCAGLRGKGDELQDLTEALDAVARAVQLASPAKEQPGTNSWGLAEGRVTRKGHYSNSSGAEIEIKIVDYI